MRPSASARARAVALGPLLLRGQHPVVGRDRVEPPPQHDDLGLAGLRLPFQAIGQFGASGQLGDPGLPLGDRPRLLLRLGLAPIQLGPKVADDRLGAAQFLFDPLIARL